MENQALTAHQHSPTRELKLIDEFILSRRFLQDAHIAKLLEKVSTLGFPFEAVKESFIDMLLQYMTATNMPNTGFYSLDLKQVFNEEKFIEKSLDISIQNDSSNKSSWSDHTSDDNEAATNESHSVLMKPEEFMYSNSSNTSSESTQEMPRQIPTLFYQLQNNHMNMNVNPFQNKHATSAAAAAASAQANKQRQSTNQEFLTQSSMSRVNDKTNLRPIVVDGNDVAVINHSAKRIFSFCRIRTVVEFFKKRGHQIFVVVPSYRRDVFTHIPPGILLTPFQMIEKEALDELESLNIMNYTMSKRLTDSNRLIKMDDDQIMLNLAAVKNAIVVSNDNFKRFLNNEDFRKVIEERVLMYSFIDDTFMPAEDPLGKNGPNLENFLRFEPLSKQQYMTLCPYKKRCTYGIKCKYWHPEREAVATATNKTGATVQFKSAHDSMMDRAAEQKLNLKKMFSQPSEDYKNDYSFDETSSIYPQNGHFGYGNGSVKSSGVEKKIHFGRSMAAGIQHPSSGLRQMGPVETKTYTDGHHAQFQNMHSINYLAKNMRNMRVDWSSADSNNNYKNNAKSQGFNPVIGGISFSPFNSTSAFVSQSQPQNAQFGQQSEFETSKNTLQNNSNKKTASDLYKEAESQGRNLSPHSVRRRLDEILEDETLVSRFLKKYQNITDESELIFLAQCMNFDELNL